jgi:ABC-type nitrate/sulfonate/bicarbonate transport system substrate-binding protein
MKNLSATLFVFFKNFSGPACGGWSHPRCCSALVLRLPARAKATEIKIVVLPIIDALPFYVAAKQGYYTPNGITVTFIPAASQPERDQLISAGRQTYDQRPGLGCPV